MALDVSITSDGTGGVIAPLTYRLQTEVVEISWNRSPIIIPIPNVDPQLLDLGQRTVAIRIDGIAEDTGATLTEGGVDVADKQDLERITETWFPSVITFTVSGEVYTVKVQSLRLTLSAAKEVWDYTLQLIGLGVT